MVDVPQLARSFIVNHFPHLGDGQEMYCAYHVGFVFIAPVLLEGGLGSRGLQEGSRAGRDKMAIASCIEIL